MRIKRRYALNLLFILLLPIIALILGVSLSTIFEFDQPVMGNLAANLIFLAATIILIRLFQANARDVGLKIIKGKVAWHVAASLVIFALYMFFYIFAIRISALRPFSTATIWGILSIFVTVLAEELYFRGFLYRYLETRLPSWLVVILTAIIFGLLHARQGLSGILYRSTAGWLWGSVRYSSGMIFLLIFPIHFFYNSMWFLFLGNWSNPPQWANYGLPIVEFILGLTILLLANRSKRRKRPSNLAAN